MSKKLSFSIAVNLLTENFKKGAKTFKTSMRSMQMQVITFAAALGAGGLGLSGLLSRFRDVARETSRVLTSLKNVSDGTKGFADNLRFVNDLANKYGLEVNALTGNFAKFTASATQANMGMDEQKKVFESLSRASTAFGLSAEDTNGVFLALSQMMGKGKISSEELRKQMGERIPIAMQAMAKAAGVSMAGLEKLLKQGKLMSADMIPKFADALNDMIPNVDTDNLETSLNRLSNAFGKIVDASGFQGKYKALIDWLTGALESAGQNIQNIVIGIVGAIVFLITNAANKIRVKLISDSKQIIANDAAMQNKLIAARAARAEAERKLEELKLLHAQASGKAQVQLYNQIEKQKQLLSSKTAQLAKVQEAAKASAAKASAVTASNAWQRASNVMRIASAKVVASLKSMWASFAPAIIISALVTIGSKLYDLLKQSDALKTSLQKYNKVKEATLQKEQEHKNKLEELISTATNQVLADMERAGALEELKKKYPEIFKEYDIEKLKLADILKLKKQISEMDNKKSVDDRKAKYEDALAAVRKAEKFLEEEKEAPTMRFERTRTAQRRLDQAKANLVPYEQDVIEDNTNSFISNLGGMSKEQIEAELKARARLEHELKKSGNTQGSIAEGALQGNFSKEQLSQQTEALKTELDNRNQARYNYVELEKKYTAELKALQDRRKEIEKSSEQLTEQELTEQLKNIDGEIAARQSQLKELTSNPKTSSGELDNKALSAAEKRLEALRKLGEEERKLKIDAQKFDLEIQQKALDAEDDSFAKRTKQTMLNLEKEQLAIDEFQHDMLKKQEASAKTKYVSINGSDKGFDYSKFDKSQLPQGLRPEDIVKQVDQLTQAAQAAFDKANELISKERTELLEKERMVFESELNQTIASIKNHYKALKQQYVENSTEYKELQALEDKEISLARLAHDRKVLSSVQEVYEKQLELTDKFYLLQTKKELALLKLKQANNSGLIKSLKQEFATVTGNNFDELSDDELKALINEYPELIALIQIAIIEQARLNKELKQIPTKVLNEAFAIFSSAVSELSGLEGEIGSFFSEIGKQLNNIKVAFDKDASSAEKVGAAVSGIVSGINMITSASQKRNQAEQEYYKNAIAFAHEYALALNDQLRLHSELSASGFVKDYAGQLNDGYKALEDAVNNYYESVGKLSEGKVKVDLVNAIDWGNIGKGAAAGAGAGAAIGSIVPVIGTVVGGLIGGLIGGIAGLFGGKKKKNEFAGLVDVFPGLVDGAGNLNKELAQTLVNTEQTDEKTKQLLQNALDWADAIEEANKQIKGIVLELAGDLGNNLQTAIVDAWKAGEDASVAMFKTAGKSLEGFIEKLLWSAVFGDLFKQFEEDLAESLNPNTGDGDIVDDYLRLMAGLDGRDDAYIAMLEAIKNRPETAKLGLWDNEDSKTQASTKGYSVSMDQDTGGAILGRITGLHETGLRIESMMSAVSVCNTQSLLQTVLINDELQKHTAIFDEMQQLQIKSFNISKEVKENLAVLDGMKTALDDISKNTKKL